MILPAKTWLYCTALGVNAFLFSFWFIQKIPTTTPDSWQCVDLNQCRRVLWQASLHSAESSCFIVPGRIDRCPASTPDAWEGARARSLISNKLTILITKVSSDQKLVLFHVWSSGSPWYGSINGGAHSATVFATVLFFAPWSHVFFISFLRSSYWFFPAKSNHSHHITAFDWTAIKNGCLSPTPTGFVHSEIIKDI